MKHLVMGTAGHVDHGKTALVKALTGIDTDRLKEEKKRGITIELGFASLPLDDGQMLSIIDVPGHEKFVKNMVAGASGMDFVLFVIAADEGVMPQTREHMNICSFLGLTNGIVALTKADMVDKEWLSLVTDDVRKFIDDTNLKDAPIVPVSSVTGSGIDELVRTIKNTVKITESKRTGADIFRLPIDRVFTMKGFGTVVTGTVISGSISTAEEVEILPNRIVTKIRMMQSHGQALAKVSTGQRVAINLLNVEKSAIERGAMITPVNAIELSRRLDVLLSCNSTDTTKKIKNRDIVRFHSATSEIIARIVLLDADELRNGEQCFAQIFLMSPFSAIAGDRFVIRSYSPITTIGGGIILDPIAKKQKRQSAEEIKDLQELAIGDLITRIEIIVKRMGYKGATTDEIVVRTGENRDKVSVSIKELIREKKIVIVDETTMGCIFVGILEEIQQTIAKRLDNYHKRNPLKKNIPKEELRILTGAFLPVKVFALALKQMEVNGTITIEQNDIRLTSHSVFLKDDMSELRAKVINIYSIAKLSPPTAKELALQFSSTKIELKSVFTMLVAEKILLKVNEELFFDATTIDTLRNDYTNVLIEKGKATLLDFKELTGLPRKFIIPLMEYFDAIKMTIRVGDARILRDKK